MLNVQDLHPEYITDEKGKKKSVILSISNLQELMEDIEDLAIIAERKNEETVSHDKLLKELKQNGLL